MILTIIICQKYKCKVKITNKKLPLKIQIAKLMTEAGEIEQRGFSLVSTRSTMSTTHAKSNPTGKANWHVYNPCASCVKIFFRGNNTMRFVSGWVIEFEHLKL